MRFVIRVIVSSLAMWVVDWLFDGIYVTGNKDSTLNEILTYVVIGAIIAVINTFVAPIIKLLAIPFYIITLGLIGLLINAGLLELVAWISTALPVTLHIDEFWWTAIWAALILSIVTMLLNAILPDGD
jgi:putative membrane protein